MLFRTALLLTLAVALQACHYKKLKTSGTDDSQPLKIEAIDFAYVLKEVIGPKCLECHSSAGRGGTFSIETYPEVIENLAAIQDSVRDDYMPKRRAPLTARQKEILNSWILAGAPQFISPVAKPTQPQPEPPPVPEIPEEIEEAEIALNWLSISTLVIEPACVRCHRSPTGRGDVNLDSYQEVLRNITLSEKTVREGSMPKRGTMTDEQKDLLYKWIEAGAPEFSNP